MVTRSNEELRPRIEKIAVLTGGSCSGTDPFEAGALALTVLHDTVGSAHPLMAEIRNALESRDWNRSKTGALTVVTLFNEGGLQSPRLAIAHEIEGSLLDIAEVQ